MENKFDEEAMKKAKNLTIALSILDNYWEKFSDNLTNEQRSRITSEIMALEPKIRNSTSIADASEEAVKFFKMCSQIEPLYFLTEIDDSLKRGGTLNSVEEEVKIKILNYCVLLKNKMQENP